MARTTHSRWGRWLALTVTALCLAACDRPPVEPEQRGYRGTGMTKMVDTEVVAAEAPLHTAPAIAAPARVRASAPIAGEKYKNIKVLNDLTVGEFGRTMNSMTAWVSPKQSCAYCHVDGDFASDAKYTKVVARQMIQMTRHLNTNWKQHIGETGVTCYTCHRGNPLPAQRWFKPMREGHPGNNLLADRQGQNAPMKPVGLAALPADPFTAYLLSPQDSANVRVVSTSALHGGAQPSVKQAEQTYGLMVHISQSLGVNCTFCHNSRSFSNWAQSPIQRTTAYHGIRMARDVNSQYLEPLLKTFPAAAEGRLGPTGDTAKVNCATCHQGASKPLNGAEMARHFPALWQPGSGGAGPLSGDNLLVPDAHGQLPAPAAAPPALSASDAALLARHVPPAAASSSVVAMAAPTPAAPVPAPSPSLAPAPVPSAMVSPPVAAALAPNCIDASAQALKQGSRVAAEAAQRQVVGSGKLQFYAAPDARCEMVGVFIQPGEAVVARAEQGGYTSVVFHKASTGAEATGWVASDRLVKPAAPVVAAAAAATATTTATGHCAEVQAQATKTAVPVPPSAVGRRVVGSGRLQFHTAPDLGCKLAGVFILPGESVDAQLDRDGFTAVRYVNPRTGAVATGWVASERLEPLSRSLAQR